MGMPHALRAITAWRALAIMAPLTLVGATFASHKVEHTVGHNLLAGAGLSLTGLVIVIGVAFGLTSLFNAVRVPTSTIQILVFTVVGAGLAAGIGVRWPTIATLAVIWVAVPVVAAAIGFVLTRGLDLIPTMPADAPITGAHLTRTATAIGSNDPSGGPRLATTTIASTRRGRCPPPDHHGVLGHKSTAMAMIYTRISDPEVRRQYEAALTAGQRIAGPAAEALLRGEMSEEAVHWLQASFLKTELELGHCLRLPAEPSLSTSPETPGAVGITES